MDKTMEKIKNNLKKNSNKGLTLVELMVVISIFLVISGVTIFDYGNFRSNVSLQNLTDDIALSIRKAQGFAIGARGIGIGAGTTFNKSYGMHFTIDSAPSYFLNGSKKSFLMFSTTTSTNKYYDSSSSGACGDATNECEELFNITSNDIIKKIFIDDVDKTSAKSSLDIVFTRPDPRAYFCYRAVLTDACTPASHVDIIISNGQTDASKEKTRTISVQNTGQISITQ